MPNSSDRSFGITGCHDLFTLFFLLVCFYSPLIMAVVTDTLILTRAISTFILCSLIYGPICMYCRYKFYKHIDDVIIRKRYGMITIFETMFTSTKLIWNGIVFMLGLKIRKSILCPLVGLSYCAGLGIEYCLFWRFWILYFEIKFQVASINGQWQKMLDPNFIDNKDSYFIQHKKTLGNYKWFGSRIVIPLLIISSLFLEGCCIYVGIVWGNTPQWNIYLERALLINTPLYLWPTISLFVIWCKTPKLEDQFFISKELGYLCWSNAGFLVFYIFDAIAQAKESSGDTFKDIFPFICLWIQTVGTHTCSFISVLIATYWVITQIDQTGMQLKPLRSEDVKLVPLVNHSSNTYTGRNSTISKQQFVNKMTSLISGFGDDETEMTNTLFQKRTITAPENITLSSVLEHPKGFESFMRYLSTEFSIENLLALVEFIQFETVVYQIINRNESNQIEEKNVEDLWGIKITLPSNVPLSYIIFNGQSMNELLDKLTGYEDDEKVVFKLKHICHALYKKYIANGSELEINIAYGTRKGLIGLVGDDMKLIDDENIDIFKLLTIYDVACGQIYNLMGDSYRRFKRTPQFANMQNLLLL